MEKTDCIVAGAGVIGLAVARALARQGREVIILEAADAVGTGISSRSSEVIHAGIYYPKDSHLARFCVAGRRMLYDFCRDYGVPCRKYGKLIVAVDEEEAARLHDLKPRAEANGVENLRLLSKAEAQAMEPQLACAAALYSPETGVIDSHAYIQALLGDAQQHGAQLALNSPATGAQGTDGGMIVETGGAHPMRLSCRLLINAAGLGAIDLAHRIRDMPKQIIPKPYYAKGSYFSLSAPAPFRHLIYPLPIPGGLGVHLALDTAGRARFGPDVEWVDPPLDYHVDPGRAAGFYAAIRRFWPELKDAALQPDYAGIRPKIVPPGAPKQDFVIQGHEQHGLAGLINLFGIESPGLTAALALAAHIASA